VQLDLKELQGLREIQDHKVILEVRVIQELVIQDPKVIQVFKVILEVKVIQELEIQELKETLEL
jgi:hypothetical protein